MDANVCVSAVLSAKGRAARLLDHVLEEGPHDFELRAPSQLFLKVEEVLARPKIAGRLKWGPARIGLYARRLRLAVTEVPIGDPEKVPSYIGDPEDDPYVLAAVLVGAPISSAATKTSSVWRPRPCRSWVPRSSPVSGRRGCSEARVVRLCGQTSGSTITLWT